MINTGYPYDGFEEMYSATETTPEWYGFGHKHMALNYTPIRHLILADGQQRAEISVTDPDEPLDHLVADQLRGQPAEQANYPVSVILSMNRTERPTARPDLETGQFQHPDTRPGLLGRFFRRKGSF